VGGAVYTGRFVGERPVEGNILKLAFGVLVEAADSDIADVLTIHIHSPDLECQDELRDPLPVLSTKAFLTLF